MKPRSHMILPLMLSGCAFQTFTSGVQQMGPDTYTVAAHDASPAIAKQTAYTAARQHCANMRRELIVSNESQGPLRNHYITDLTFRCLAAGDPALTRPTYDTAPTVRIEDARKR